MDGREAAHQGPDIAALSRVCTHRAPWAAVGVGGVGRGRWGSGSQCPVECAIGIWGPGRLACQDAAATFSLGLWTGQQGREVGAQDAQVGRGRFALRPGLDRIPQGPLKSSSSSMSWSA